MATTLLDLPSVLLPRVCGNAGVLACCRQLAASDEDVKAHIRFRHCCERVMDAVIADAVKLSDEIVWDVTECAPAMFVLHNETMVTLSDYVTSNTGLYTMYCAQKRALRAIVRHALFDPFQWVGMCGHLHGQARCKAMGQRTTTSLLLNLLVCICKFGRTEVLYHQLHSYGRVHCWALVTPFVREMVRAGLHGRHFGRLLKFMVEGLGWNMRYYNVLAGVDTAAHLRPETVRHLARFGMRRVDILRQWLSDVYQFPTRVDVSERMVSEAIGCWATHRVMCPVDMLLTAALMSPAFQRQVPAVMQMYGATADNVFALLSRTGLLRIINVPRAHFLTSRMRIPAEHLLTLLLRDSHEGVTCRVRRCARLMLDITPTDALMEPRFSRQGLRNLRLCGPMMRRLRGAGDGYRIRKNRSSVWLRPRQHPREKCAPP
jgi:hypothetical protein